MREGERGREKSVSVSEGGRERGRERGEGSSCSTCLSCVMTRVNMMTSCSPYWSAWIPAEEWTIDSKLSYQFLPKITCFSETF